MVDNDYRQRMKDEGLAGALEHLAASDRYPFHMPGHKRNMAGIGNPYAYDITEIADFDDLAEPEGILADLLEELRTLYEAGSAFLSLNGSTGSNLIGIFAATEQKDEVLVASNCHRSVFHAAELRELTVHIIEPTRYEAEGRRYDNVCGAIAADDVALALREHPRIKLVILTSPTYEGVVSDISSLAKIVHAHGAKLYVDGAHGAHLTIANRFLKESALDTGTEFFPTDALLCGADAVSVSLHKTLPMPGMSSLLLLPKHGEISRERAAHYWQIFQSSSPSYLLMAMVDNGVRWLKNEGERAFVVYAERLKEFYRTADFQKLSVLPPIGRDPGKLVILLPENARAKKEEEEAKKKTGEWNNISQKFFPENGYQLADLLLREYAIDMERAEKGYVIAMTSVMDTEEGFARLIDALRQIDLAIVK